MSVWFSSFLLEIYEDGIHGVTTRDGWPDACMKQGTNGYLAWAFYARSCMKLLWLREQRLVFTEFAIAMHCCCNTCFHHRDWSDQKTGLEQHGKWWRRAAWFELNITYKNLTDWDTNNEAASFGPSDFDIEVIQVREVPRVFSMMPPRTRGVKDCLSAASTEASSSLKELVLTS